MQYRPTAAELLEAMADLLGREVLAEVPEHLQHRVRVAENLARILEREVRLGPEADRREEGRLRELLGHDGRLEDLRAELCDMLRADGGDAAEAAAWTVLVETARDDLAIAKPGHDGWEGT